MKTEDSGLLEAAEAQPIGTLAAVVRQGLAAWPKSLPPWLFYDAAGSELFEQITRLEEYYLTRAEREIFEVYAREIIGRVGGDSRLSVVELGSGTADKTRLLLSAVLAAQGGEAVYEPVDVSATALEAARERLGRELPGLLVRPHVLDYTKNLRLGAAAQGERRLVLFIGSSMGNFDPPEAERLLERLRAALTPGDCFLLGVDLVKDPAVLEAAYNDAAGVTAAFNLNLLNRLNRELGAGFRLDRFRHRAFWNQTASRIEMHLESLEPQTVPIPALAMRVEFAKNETIHTENSYKYRPGEAAEMLLQRGFRPRGAWTDSAGRFEAQLAEAVG